MPHPMKIAKCCYCGTRAALVLDKSRHELSCGACGAPLHDMKMMPKAAAPVKQPAKSAAPPLVKKSKPRKSKDYEPRSSKKKPLKRKLKSRMKWGRDMIEDIWDVVEDIFD